MSAASFSYRPAYAGQPRRGALPRVSVVIVSTGSPSQLDACLAALGVRQGVADAELIVVAADHASSLSAVMTAYADIRLVAAPPGSTVGQLRTLGVAEAKGDVVAMLESDRVVPDKWLEALTWRLTGAESEQQGSTLADADATPYLTTRRVAPHGTSAPSASLPVRADRVAREEPQRGTTLQQALRAELPASEAR
jgi:hypothetical protein